MPITIQCPNPSCRASESIADSFSGKNIKCTKCGAQFIATPAHLGDPKEPQRSTPSSAGEPFPTLPTQFGRYRVLKKLGQGGMGAVYLAEDSQLARQVALKLPSFDASEAKRVERFEREAKSAAVLRHPNICPVFDAGRIEGRLLFQLRVAHGHLERGVAGRDLVAVVDVSGWDLRAVDERAVAALQVENPATGRVHFDHEMPA